MKTITLVFIDDIDPIEADEIVSTPTVSDETSAEDVWRLYHGKRLRHEYFAYSDDSLIFGTNLTDPIDAEATITFAKTFAVTLKLNNGNPTKLDATLVDTVQSFLLQKYPSDVFEKYVVTANGKNIESEEVDIEPNMAIVLLGKVGYAD